MSTPAPHKIALDEAIALEGEGHRLLMAGDRAAAAERLGAAADRYRASWEAAGPTAFGRLVGLLKARLLAGADARADADYVLEAAGGDAAAGSPVASYARAFAVLVTGDAAAARDAVAGMRAGGEAFTRTADALQATADGDAGAYSAALAAMVADFEGRDAHLTGVPIADTALMLDALAHPRGLPGLPTSPVLPPA